MNSKDITLICVEDRDTFKAKELVNQQKQLTGLNKSIVFGDSTADICIPKIKSIRDYNLFIISKLNQYVDTNFCLIIQLDGYVINPKAWTDDFLNYDYIGAPWYLQPWDLNQTVGNGGFSLRSKKLLEEGSNLIYDGSTPEDVFLCRQEDKSLKSKGIKFAPHDKAYTFSVEDMPYKGQFGFHGKHTILLNKSLGIFK